MKKTVTIVIEYDHENDRDAEKAAKRLVQADRAFTALQDVRDDMLRPAINGDRYGRGKLDEMILGSGDVTSDNQGGTDLRGQVIIECLAEIFDEILTEHGIDLEDA